MRISDWSSDVCSSDLPPPRRAGAQAGEQPALDGQPAAVFLQPEAPVLQQRQHYREHAQQDREREQRGKDRQRVLAEAEVRSEEHTSELQSLMRISYAVFCLKKQKHKKIHTSQNNKITQY